MITTREWRLVARPVGQPRPGDFELATTTLPELAEGQVLVANDWLSVDPYMRGRMDEGDSYLPAFELGAPMSGSAVGTVLASRSDGLPVGATVLHQAGWREHAVLGAAEAQPVDVRRSPAPAYLGVLGATGLTAYVGMTRIAKVRPGDAVFVSGAAGAVGSVAGQIARHLGATRVIGAAGGPQKTALVTSEFGFDAAIDYRAGDLTGQLAAAAPDGIDVYFDNVGGEHLQAALNVLNDFGRVALCGAISGYNAADPPPGPNNLMSAVEKRILLHGFIVGDHFDLIGEWVRTGGRWLAEGTLRVRETVVDGIDNALDAFLGMMRGTNVGKMVVRLDSAAADTERTARVG
ncbi:NADP-dependent oxidoreductase [Mycolicibacillus trivialis]|uniref:NADP-dependent oxidoreductase n=1 Tax=Mycolicibacillus trivialis TaxID=1798 RepID=A0A1X2EHD0_9MYCO|nr:NADP-dependent oxidoreductase [Mycolicibacillus trivialis]ORX02156.1 NADP-dependent oxidoreductase [Mycolicibacillus trivialis]